MKHRADLKSMLSAPWALFPRTLTRIVEAARSADPALAAGVVQTEGTHDAGNRVGGVAIIPVYGVIEHHSDWLMEWFGGTSVDGLRESLHAALVDPQVRAVLLDVDSPGGTVAGITELAAEIRNARGGTKPIVAIANAFAASAAYWLASQADEVVITPSGYVGSIGIYAVHQDISRMLEEAGVTVTLISAGPHKTEGNEFEPLSEDAAADLQERVDASYDQFLSDVAAGRRTTVAQVRESYGGGRVLGARNALAAGMVDRIATVAATVQRLDRGSGRTAGRARAAAGLPVLESNAIEVHATETADEPWDPAAEGAALPDGEGAGESLRRAHAWADEEADANAAGSYQLLHHGRTFVEAGPAEGVVGPANVAACRAGITILNDRAAGIIPDADRRGVYAHLAAHLTDAGETPEPLVSLVPFTERLVAAATEVTDLVAHARERARLRGLEGRPAFSTTTERSLRAIREAVDLLLEPGDPDPSPPPPPVEPVAGAAVPPARPAAVTVPPAVPATPAFRSREDWLAYLEASR